MKQLLCLVLLLQLAFPVWAQVPVQNDFPRNPHPPGRTVRLQPRESAPWSGTLYEDSERARRDWEVRNTQDKLAKLEREKANRILTTPQLIATILGVLAVGVGGTLAICVVTDGCN